MKKRDSDKLKATYDYIVDYMLRNQIASTLREIAIGAGLKSSSTVSYYLKQLSDDDLIRLDAHEGNFGIRLVGYKLIKISNDDIALGDN